VSSQAIIAVQPSDAVYKGLAIASTIPGNVAGDLLYATNFHAGTVDVFDHTFAPVHTHGAFTDTSIPKGYAPFGIRNIGGIIYVTYALQDADAHDDVPGMGHGFVNAFDTAGHLLRHVATRGTLNSPWGLALSPADFGKFSNDLLVGNFGNGRIHAYDPGDTLGNGEFKHRGMLHSAGGGPLVIDGLGALSFGNGVRRSQVHAPRLFSPRAPAIPGLFGRFLLRRLPLETDELTDKARPAKLTSSEATHQQTMRRAVERDGAARANHGRSSRVRGEA
jgi:uncharacterized protein (TIGR03118 family)